MPTDKQCTKCQQTKSIRDFGKNSSRGSGLESQCRACLNDKWKKFRELYPERYKSYKTKGHRKHKYGLGLEDYIDMKIAQNDLCAICFKPETCPRKVELCIDHDHLTGKIRGLLCNTCNRALGLFKDNPELLNSAILYLKGGKNA